MIGDIVTSENFYLTEGAKISFFFDEDIDGYEITEAEGNAEKLIIPDKINGRAVKNVDAVFYKFNCFDEVMINKGSLYFNVVDGVLFSRDMQRLIIYPPQKRDEIYAVPPGVKEICGDSVNNGNIRKIYLPEGLEFISQYSVGCPGLEEIYIPGTLKKVYFKAFAGCRSLKRVFYRGTEDQWNKIDFTDFNHCLTEAEIRFEADISFGKQGQKF